METLFLPQANAEEDFYPMTTRMYRKGTLTPGFYVFSNYEGREYKARNVFYYTVFPFDDYLYRLCLFKQKLT